MAYNNPAQIQMYLSDMDYPCSRSDIVEHAASHGASEDILQSLEHLPGERYTSAADLDRDLSDME